MGALRADASRPVDPRHRRLRASAGGGRVEEGCWAVVRRKRRTFGQVRSQERIRQLSGARVEQQLGSLAGRGRAVPRPRLVGVGLAEPSIALTRPIPHRRVVSLRSPRRRELALDPRRHVRRSNRGARAVGIDGRTRQRLRGHGGGDRVRAIRERGQRGHAVGRSWTVLRGVVDAPDPPHPREVVLRDVAVVEQVARGLLAAPGATLIEDVEGLGRSQRLRVGALGQLRCE